MFCVFILPLLIPLSNQTGQSDCIIALEDCKAIANYTSEASWHHDCSNLTAFDGIGNDSWITEPGYNVSGSMNSSGTYFYADDYGYGGFGHGPLRYHTFSSPIQLAQFISIEAELELDANTTGPPVSTQLGNIMVILYDEFEKEVMTIQAAQVWDDGYPTRIEAFARWRFSNGTKIEATIDDVQQEPYHDTLRISQNETGLFANFPRFGNYSILANNQIESSRVITYVALYIGATFSFPPTEVLRVHNLLMEYGITDTGTISSTTTTESTTNSTTTMSLIDPQTITYILAAAGVVALVVILLRRRS